MCRNVYVDTSEVMNLLSFSPRNQTGGPRMGNKVGHQKTSSLIGWFLKKYVRGVGRLIFQEMSRNISKSTYKNTVLHAFL